MRLTPGDYVELESAYPGAYRWIVARENLREAESLAAKRRVERERGRAGRYTLLNPYSRGRLAVLLRLYRWRVSAGWATEAEHLVAVL